MGIKSCGVREPGSKGGREGGRGGGRVKPYSNEEARVTKKSVFN